MSSQSSFTFAHAHGGPLGAVQFRQTPEDFFVEERLPFLPCGSGEHVYVQVRKRNTNTDWLARQLAQFAGLSPKAVSYAGLKDRNAVAVQWFSLHMPKPEDLDWPSIESEDLQVLEVSRHQQKLRKGMLKGNTFRIRLADCAFPNDALEDRMQCILREGVPNYFGEQRFGHGGGNLEKARALFTGKLREKNRHKRGLYLSAARSYLFNRVLSARVEQGNWNHALAGDCFMLAGSNSFFCPDELDEVIQRRLQERDIHPSGPLWGRGTSPAREACATLEQAIVGQELALCEGLEAAGLKQERRSLRLFPEDLQWSFADDGHLEVSFFLPAGTYATVVLREIVSWESGFPE